MERLNDYLNQVKDRVTYLGGSEDLLDEFATNILEEYEEFKKKSQEKGLESEKIEENFIHDLESPEVIAKSLMGMDVPKKKPYLVEFADILVTKWKWYQEEVLSQQAGVRLTLVAAWLLPSVVLWIQTILNVYIGPLAIFGGPEITHVVNLPFSSEELYLNYYFPIILSIIFYLMTINIVMKYPVSFTFSTITLCAFAYTMGLMSHRIPHYLDPRWLSQTANVEQIIIGFVAGYCYWFMELVITSLFIGYIIKGVMKNRKEFTRSQGRVEEKNREKVGVRK